MTTKLVRIIFSLAMALLPLLSFYLMYLGIAAYRDIRSLREEGITDLARIIRKFHEYEEDHFRTNYLVYRLSADQPSVRESVEPDIYQTYESGDSVTIIYLPDNPQTARIFERGVSYRAAVVRFGLGILLLILLGGYSWRISRGKNP